MLLRCNEALSMGASKQWQMLRSSYTQAIRKLMMLITKLKHNQSKADIAEYTIAKSEADQLEAAKADNRKWS